MSDQQRGPKNNAGSRPHTNKVIIEEDENPQVSENPVKLPLKNTNSQAFEKISEEQRDKESAKRIQSLQSLRKDPSTANILDQDDLEIKLQNSIEEIQTAYFTVCKKLMKLYIFIMTPQIGFALYQLIDCGCFNSDANNLICIVHYLKIAFNIFNIRRYIYNIRDYQCHHPVGSLNTFIMITFYYAMLFVYIHLLKEKYQCVYLIGLYPLTDFSAVIYSLFQVKRIVERKRALETRAEYKDQRQYQTQIQTKLREVLYLPVAFESDIEEDHDD